MKIRLTAILAVILAVVMAVGCIPAGAVYLNGDKTVDYTVFDAETHVLGEGLVYNQYSFTDSKGIEQTCFTMEFNPKTSDFRSYVYHTKASHGYTITDDVVNAKKDGLEVYAAINGDFFSMDTVNYGTPIGMYITEGKLAVSSAGLSQYNLVIAEDGTADVVYSKLAYGLTINGASYNNNLVAVNKRAGDYGANNIYYFDKHIGTASPVSVAVSRTEILCKVTEGSLSVGGTLKGEVLGINAKGGTTIGEGQFVLSAGNGLSLAEVPTGAEVVLTVNETVEGSKTAMENAYHAIYAHQVMKVDGYDRWANGDLVDPGLSEQFAQRCVVGIKEDGTIIYFVCDGRKAGDNGTNGFNYDMIMEIMAPYNCTDIVNFDGGGSTAAVISEGDGMFNWEFIGSSPSRAVANSILIVRDPNAEVIPDGDEDMPIVDKDGTELRNVAINKTYTVNQNGNFEPTYLSSFQGDTGTKLTNGKYRTAADSADSFSATYIGTGSQLNMVIDLATQRDDIRNVTWRGVSIGGNRSFIDGGVIVYVSEDGQNWSKSVAGTYAKTATEVSGVYDCTYSFNASQSGRYLKLIFGTTTYALQFDEIEVYAMVDENEPIEEPIPEDTTNLPAELPDESCVNVALGKTYTITCDGSEIAAANSGVDPRYYSPQTAETETLRLTDGRIGTAGNYMDGATLAIRSGSNAEIEIILDLGELTEKIEFVRLRNIIDNGSSFGKLDTARVSYSTDGAEYTEATCRLNSEAVTNTSYHNLTLQLTDAVSARYIKVNITTPKFLLGFGELQVYTSAAPAPEYELGDGNCDGMVDSADAVQALQYDIGILSEDDIQDLDNLDVNGDGGVDSADAVLILQFDAGLIESF